MHAEDFQDLPVPIVHSKLHPPAVAQDTILRNRLLEMESSVTWTPMTLVTAPAGYGKSTLVRQWLEKINSKSAWLSLDPMDGDFVQFLSYMIAAVRSAFPGSCSTTADMLRSAVLPGVTAIAGLFSNDLEPLEGPVVLVLDDYYQIQSSDIDEFIDTLLRHPPPNLHLIIVSRHDPGLSLQSLRASGILTEIRMKQLAFHEDETRAFVRNVLGGRITENEISRLHQRLEGWPAGLRLASMAAPKQDAVSDFFEQFSDDTLSIRSYLTQEVLALQSEEVREYLLRTAFLDRFCAELCEAIMPEDSALMPGREFVNHIRQHNLFSIALDAGQVWFRYHHLFQALLQDAALTDLDGATIQGVHQRASVWFENNGFLEEAIRQAVRSGGASEASNIIVRNRLSIMNREQWPRLNAWLQLLPQKSVTSQPELLLLKARIMITTGRNAELAQTLDHAESLLDTAIMDDTLKRELSGSLASMRCYQFYIMSDGERAARTAQQALEYLPSDGQAERGFAMILLGAAMQMTGDIKGAKRKMQAALANGLATTEGGITYRTRLFTSLCCIHWMNGDLMELKTYAEASEKLCMTAHLGEVLTAALHFRAASYYHRNELSTVEGVLQEIIESKAIYSPDNHAHCHTIAALTYEALGDSDKAMQIAESLNQLAFRTHNLHLTDLAEAFAAELALRQGRTAEALKWASEYDPEPLVPMYGFFSPQICLAKILVLDNNAHSQKRAQALLCKLEAYLAAIHNGRFLMETLALRAILSDRAGNEDLALEQLGRALSLAQPGGFIRVFVDIGPELIPLLNRLELRGDQLKYVGRILAAYHRSGDAEAAQRQSTLTRVTIPTVAGLPETLSRREQEVLVLLAERLSNKEIGERLFIATATVKRHAQTIYEKLHVKGRREAVAKALGLGLISDKPNNSFSRD